MRSYSVLAFVLLSLPSPIRALEPDQVYAKVAPSIVVVVGFKASKPKDSTLGSGVIIAPGQIVTNCHVIEGADLINVRREKFSSLALLRFEDPDRDLCQISAVNKSGFDKAISAVVSVSELRVGQRVYAIGAPQGLDLTLSDGLISSLRSIDEVGTIIQTNAPISQGSSGGGLFDTNGRLIGITSFQHKYGQNLNFAVPAGWILELPSRHVEREELNRSLISDIAPKEKLRRQKEEEAARREEEKGAKAERKEEQRKAELEQRRLEEEQLKAIAEELRAEEEQKRSEEEVRRVEEQRRLEEQRRVEAKREEERMRRQKEAEALAQWRQYHDTAYEVQKRQLERWRTTDIKAETENPPIPRGFVAGWIDYERKMLQEHREREEERKQQAIALERARQQQEAVRKQFETEEAKRKVEAAARVAQQKLIDNWKFRIQVRIKSRIVVPPNIEGNPQALFEVVLLPGGEVWSATLKTSSGNAAYDKAIERAITAAQPLPVPTDGDLFHENFRELNLYFRPKD